MRERRGSLANRANELVLAVGDGGLSRPALAQVLGARQRDAHTRPANPPPRRSSAEFELIVALLGLILFFIVVQAIKFFPALPAHPAQAARRSRK